jgi:hypothetical protein
MWMKKGQMIVFEDVDVSIEKCKEIRTLVDVYYSRSKIK